MKERGSCELNRDFADVLPVLALADFLGVEIASDGPLEIWPGIQANGIVSLPLRFRAAA